MKRRGVKVLAQRHDFDCGVAALAMYLGLSYGDVAASCRSVFGSTKPTKRGLGLYHLETIAEALGHPLRRCYRKKDYLELQTGILGLMGGNMSWAGHWVVYKNGMILDPDGGEAWDALDYLHKNKTRPCTLLVEA
jgi:hypothetical protein